jgi:hypothetical protein
MDSYKDLLTEVDSALKLLGFKKKGVSFYKKCDNNWEVINFQKSDKCSGDVVIFTINVGVFSTALSQISQQQGVSDPPQAVNCHWRARIGQFLKQPVDHWWTIDKSKAVKNSIVNEVKSLLIDKAIPKMDELGSDSALVQYWLGGKYAGTAVQTYTSLLLLVKAHDRGRLPKIIEELSEREGEKFKRFLPGFIEGWGL